MFSEDFPNESTEHNQILSEELGLEESPVFDPELEKNIQKLRKQITKINQIIQKAAPEWPLEGMNKVDLAILRISVYELLQKETPHRVVIDEAIEIAKEYGAENSAKFVNGVLAAVANEHRSAEQQEVTKQEVTKQEVTEQQQDKKLPKVKKQQRKKSNGNRPNSKKTTKDLQ